MRIARLAFLSAFAAGTLAAQGSARAPASILQTATIDVASAFQQHYRAMIEPLVFGRFAIGLSGEYTTEPDGPRNDYILYPVAGCSIETLCTGDRAPFDGSRYRAWSFNLHGRWYPSALSFKGQRQSAALYVGEFIGFHERRTTQPVYYGCPSCYTGPPPPDSAGVGLQPVPPGSYYNPYTQVLRGWEPGAEFGVRVLPLRHVVMDVGGRFRLARLDDYQSGTRPGGVDGRLVVTIGVGW